MAKPKKYPRKLRQTLEKIRDGKEPDDEPKYQTLMMQLLMTQKVEIMHVRVDEAAMKMETVYRLRRANPAAVLGGSLDPAIRQMFKLRPRSTYGRAPWLPDETPPSA